MPDPVKETQADLPLDGDPVQSVEDPSKVAEIFQKSAEQVKREAAQSLEYVDPEAPPAETPPVEEPPAVPEAKPAKKAKKAKETPPIAPKTEPETPTVSKREAFKAKADKEDAYRAKEDKLKERESKAQAQIERAEAVLRELENDPYAYMEKKNPRFFEELAEKHIAGGKTPEKSETAALRAELVALTKKIEGNQEDTTKEIQLANYERQLNDGERILSGPEFDAVRESAALHERFNGKPSDLRKALAEVWVEYKNMYNQELTPTNCCEILLEDAQAHIERVGNEFGQKTKPADPQTPKKKTPPTGKTLTNAQETASAPAPGDADISQFKNKSEWLRHIADTQVEMVETEE